MWDVFISHAAEDKDRVARPLAEALSAAGFKVWYDELTLRLGDGLARTIDRGLAESRYGIVVLSPSFFAKEWPRRELDGLTVREISAGKVILPVWHEVSRADVERYSPTLADKLGVSTERGMAHVVEEVVRVLAIEPAASTGAGRVAAAPPRPEPAPSPRRRKTLIAVASGAVVALAAAVQFGRRATALPDLTGRWVIRTTERTPKTYLNLEVSGAVVSGTTETLGWDQPKAMISDGRLTPQRVSFTTTRGDMPAPNGSYASGGRVQHFDGRIEADGSLHFAIQMDGGYFEEVVAERAVPVLPHSKRVATLLGHRSTVDRMAVLPDGRLASASRDKTVRVWNLATGRSELELIHEESVHSLAALDSAQLVTADMYDVRVWDLRSGTLLRTFVRDQDHLTDMLPVGGGRLATGRLGGVLDLWDIAAGRVEKSLGTDGNPYIARMALLRDGRLVSGDRDGTLRLWDLARGQSQVLGEPGERGTSHPVLGLEAMPDGRIAVTRAQGKQNFLLDLASGQEQAIELPKKPVWLLVVAAFDDGRLVTVDANEEVSLWDPATRKAELIADLEPEGASLVSFVQLPGRRFAMGLGNDKIAIHQLD